MKTLDWKARQQELFMRGRCVCGRCVWEGGGVGQCGAAIGAIDYNASGDVIINHTG